MNKWIRFSILFLLVSSMGCKSSKQNTTDVSYTGEQTIIYTMKNDYSKNVPVTLNDTKTEIVAYPSPKDIYYKGKPAYPTPLEKGWWLDNRGIGPNTAFLKMTYEEYSKLSQAPSLTDMMQMLMDTDPITGIYNLGNRDRFKDEITEINRIITHGDLKKFKKLK